MLKEKNLKIWNYLGPRICQYYSEKKKVEVKYVPATM